MSAGGARSERVHVLLVEDDETVSAMYRLRLAMDGYRVVVAFDGETGLRLARELRPDLLVLDYQLPRLDGPALLRALRADEQTRDQPVIVLSAYDDAGRVAEGRELGVLRWLVKPHVTPAELSAVVGVFVRLELDLVQVVRWALSSSSRGRSRFGRSRHHNRSHSRAAGVSVGRGAVAAARRARR